MGIVRFNNKSSDGIFQVEVPPNYEIAEREYEVIPVPGRNGDIIIDTGSYKNVIREYAISFGDVGANMASLSNKLANWLSSGGGGYARLEDDYEPEYYKLARYSGDLSIGNIYNQAGRVTLTFDRQPQRFLKTGDTNTSCANNSVMNNPTQFESRPIIIVYGTGAGKVKIGNYTINVKDMLGHVTVNSEIEEAYKDTTNMNLQVECIGGFPRLLPGDNKITYEGGVSSVNIIPKWWTI